MFCRNCGTQLDDDAVFCSKCGSKTAAGTPPPLPAGAAVAAGNVADEDAAMKWLIPMGRSPWAIAAGYLALFSVLCLPAPFAVLFGILGLRDIKKNPKLCGKGRAWFGIVVGGFFTVVSLFAIIAALSDQ